MALLFVIGVGVGLSKDNDGIGGVANISIMANDNNIIKHRICYNYYAGNC